MYHHAHLYHPTYYQGKNYYGNYWGYHHWNMPPGANTQVEYNSNPNYWHQSNWSHEIQHNNKGDYGSQPFVVNIEQTTKENTMFRRALWTGTHLQLTLMSIGVGEDIGLEIHPHLDQFLRLEGGIGLVQMGSNRTNLDFQREVTAGDAIFVPAGKWHNLTNTGNVPIKLYSIYAPPQHPFGTVHETKEIAMAAEHDDNHY